ncbi:Uncharacterised protein [Acholeplasma oculi]|nr:hypothetical protein SAMN02745122_1054 [Acholeplasma oculi]SUT88548.1 Uncharacterised protein [Acholeplasma oculi]
MIERVYLAFDQVPNRLFVLLKVYQSVPLLLSDKYHEFTVLSLIQWIQEVLDRYVHVILSNTS